MIGLTAKGGGAEEPLPTDPALVTGTLENGLKYVVRKHPNPEGRISIWLHVSSGSLNETDNIRGIAHYLEHMAFNGSKNFAPGSVVPFFQSLGLQFGRDQNAFTSFDQTTYQLALPDTKAETIDKALLFLSDVGMRLSLLPEEIDNERGIILEEKRTRLGAQQRVQEYIQERLAPGATFGRRLPIGTEETIKSVKKPDFEGYYGKWYVPSNMTVIAVGDCDAAPVVDAIRKHFADGKKATKPADLDVGVKAYTETRAIVATDPELTSAGIQIVRIEPSRGPSLTVEHERRDLVELIGTWAFSRRIGNELAKGTRTYLGANAGIGDQANAIRMITASAQGKPENWKTMLRDLGEDLQRARLHGFTAADVDDAKTALLTQAEQAVRREGTVPARAMLQRMNGTIAAGEPIMSAQQRLDLLKRLLATITPEEVSAAFTKNFDPTIVTFVLTIPSSADVPSESQLIELGRAAVNVKPAKAAEEARATTLLKEAPKGGKVAQAETHEASGVTGAWLSNGVRVHYKFNDNRKGDASISILLAGGQIQETQGNRGVTDAATLAWSGRSMATKGLSSTQIRDFMNGKKARVNGGSGEDAMTLTVSGDPEALETGLQLAYLLLTEPLIEPAAFTQWQQGQVQRIAARKLQPAGVLGEAMAEALYPTDEPRTRPLTVEQVQALKIEAAQQWLDKLIATAPIEVTVVGDVAADKVMPLIEKYLGSLANRQRIGGGYLANERKIKRNPGPITVEKTIDIKTQQGFVLDGFIGTDAQNIRDTRLLGMAARIMSTRMVKTIREEKQLVYSISAASRPAVEYPGFGLFAAQAPTDPSKGAALAAALEEMYGAFAKAGPTEEEMTVAKKQMANLFSEQMKEPDFWMGRLSAIDYRGLKLQDIVDGPAAYQAMTAKDVQDAFARYYQPERRVRFVVTPKAPAEGEAGKQG